MNPPTDIFDLISGLSVSLFESRALALWAIIRPWGDACPSSPEPAKTIYYSAFLEKCSTQSPFKNSYPVSIVPPCTVTGILETDCNEKSMSDGEVVSSGSVPVDSIAHENLDLTPISYS